MTTNVFVNEINDGIESVEKTIDKAKLFFLDLLYKKDKEVYADYILVVQTKAFRSLTTAEERQQQKIKLESTLKLLKNNLERAGLEKKDILAGVGVAVTDHHKDRIDVSLSDAERLRLVHDIITSYDDECAGINPKLDGFELVESVFPLHDRNYNKNWIKAWSTKWLINDEDLNRLKDHFGEKIAYYFAFLQYYTIWLILPTVAGLFVNFIVPNFTILFAIFNIVWSVAFTELWRQKERKLAISWGVYNYHQVERKSPHFRPVVDPRSGEELPHFPKSRRVLRKIGVLPVIALFALTFVVVLVFYILFEVIMTEFYIGPFRDQLVYLPTIAYCLLVPALNMIYAKIAKNLNDFENYETESDYEFHLTQKIFVSNFLICYLSIFFIGWIYIPYNELIRQTLEMIFKSWGLSFTIKDVGLERLNTELKYFILTAQILNLFMEIILPYLMRFGMKTISHDGEHEIHENEDEAGLLRRIKREIGLPTYNIYEDYAEMVIQSIFVPARADSIGPWINNMTLLALLSSLTNASFIYLYHGEGKKFKSLADIKNLIYIIAFILFVFTIFRRFIRNLLDKNSEFMKNIIIESEEVELNLDDSQINDEVRPFLHEKVDIENLVEQIVCFKTD
ncbi:22378_t:CDS:2 [Entrophospora sp. SA101]|nr:22378_t:CDS:2 [Entrophospora sp. SA101]CAJ0891518.1 8552_t:CDS:2 [Entrophospora sp. SA101]